MNRYNRGEKVKWSDIVVVSKFYFSHFLTRSIDGRELPVIYLALILFLWVEPRTKMKGKSDRWTLLVWFSCFFLFDLSTTLYWCSVVVSQPQSNVYLVTSFSSFNKPTVLYWMTGLTFIHVQHFFPLFNVVHHSCSSHCNDRLVRSFFVNVQPKTKKIKIKTE